MMKSSIDILGGPYKVIADAVRQLPRRVSEDELDAPTLERAIEYRLLRALAICGYVSWYTMDAVAAALDEDDAELLEDVNGLTIADVIAGEMLADASIRFMPGISPRVSCALSSAVSAVREGLHLWANEQPESAEPRLAFGLMRLREVEPQTSKDARLADKVAVRALEYIEVDLGPVTPAGIMALMRDVSDRRKKWHDAAGVER